MVVLQYTAPDLSNVYLAYTAETAEKAMEKAMRPKSSKSARPKSSRPKSSRPKSSKKLVSATYIILKCDCYMYTQKDSPSYDMKNISWFNAIIVKNTRKNRDKYINKVHESC